MTTAWATAPDGVRLYVEETGAGVPILFIHEFSGDCRSWEPQVRSFSRRYRCITYNARGYPRSDVPAAVESYSQDIAVADALAVLDALEIATAHVVGLSMGGFCALHFGLQHPDRALSLVVAGAGYGAQPDRIQAFKEESEIVARAWADQGSAAVAPRMAVGPARVQFQNKNPRGWAEFAEQLAGHDNAGASLTMLGVQRNRPSLYALAEPLRGLTVPTLVLVGDEDEGCLEPALMLKRTIPTAGLCVLPKTGHTANLEEPDTFNRVLEDFITTVDCGRWTARDPRSIAKSTTGLAG
jgi:pimeloyl-ACP methyl ester carboxylesterase